jgi:hypothetical protein
MIYFSFAFLYFLKFTVKSDEFSMLLKSWQSVPRSYGSLARYEFLPVNHDKELIHRNFEIIISMDEKSFLYWHLEGVHQ